MDLTTVIDCMGSNLGSFPVPSGVLMAGYSTGSGGVPWTDAQFAAHPGALRYDQSPVNTPADETADIYDLEDRAGTLAELPEWVHGAWASFQTGRRPGQRSPAVYASRSNITPIVNGLLAAGITHGVSLVIAGPDTEANARAEVLNASGPFPVVGRQYQFLDTHDLSVFSTAWLSNVSSKAPPPKPGPGAQVGWKYCWKCTGLFWGPQEAGSKCPAGGGHDGSRSHTYELPFVV